MSARLKGKVALVPMGATGAARDMCRQLASEGAMVGIVDSDVTRGRALVAEILANGGLAMFARADAASPAEMKAATDQIVATFGPVTMRYDQDGSMRA